jgi:hypothetical protein
MCSILAVFHTLVAVVTVLSVHRLPPDRPCIRWLPLLLQVLSPTSLALLAEANHVQRGLAHGPVTAGHVGGSPNLGKLWENCRTMIGIIIEIILG